ncbi:MAG: CHASE2 domain-containing protein [Blastocatellia bacterium]
MRKSFQRLLHWATLVLQRKRKQWQGQLLDALERKRASLVAREDLHLASDAGWVSIVSRICLRRLGLAISGLLRSLRQAAVFFWEHFASYILVKIEDWGAGLLIVILLLGAISKEKIYDEERVLDWLMQNRYHSLLSYPSSHDPAWKITVVLIDDATLRQHPELHDPAPLPRAYLASLLQRIATLHPAVIGIDFHLDQVADPEAEGGEALLETTLCDVGKTVDVVLATNLQADYQTRPPRYTQILPLDRFLLAPRSRVGHALLDTSPLDSDTPLRRLTLSLPLKEHFPESPISKCEHVLSFPVAIAASYRKYPFAERKEWAALDVTYLAKEKLHWEAKDATATQIIDFSAPPGSTETFQTVSASLFTSGATDLTAALGAQIKDQIVLIGAGYQEATDQHKTGLSTPRFYVGSNVREKMFGVEAQAYAVATVLKAAEGKGAYLQLTYRWRSNLFTLCLAVGLFSLTRRLGSAVFPWLGVLFLIGCYWFIASIIFFYTEIWLPFLIPVSLLLIAMALISKGVRELTDKNDKRKSLLLLSLLINRGSASGTPVLPETKKIEE